MTNQSTPETPYPAPASESFTRAEDAPQGTGSYGSGYGQADEPVTEQPSDIPQQPKKAEDTSTEESEEVTEEKLTEEEDGHPPGSTPGTGAAGGPAY